MEKVKHDKCTSSLEIDRLLHITRDICVFPFAQLASHRGKSCTYLGQSQFYPKRLITAIEMQTQISGSTLARCEESFKFTVFPQRKSRTLGEKCTYLQDSFRIKMGKRSLVTVVVDLLAANNKNFREKIRRFRLPRDEEPISNRCIFQIWCKPIKKRATAAIHGDILFVGMLK